MKFSYNLLNQGVLALVHETCNYGKDDASMIDEKDSKNGVVDAIKRGYY